MACKPAPSRNIASAVKVGREPMVPELSTRAVIWIAAVGWVLLCAIVVFDYATGDPRIAWTGHRAAHSHHFNKPG